MWIAYAASIMCLLTGRNLYFCFIVFLVLNATSCAVFYALEDVRSPRQKDTRPNAPSRTACAVIVQ
jgi:hypothetical protein